MRSEQTQKNFGLERVKQMLLEHVLIELKREPLSRFENAEQDMTWKGERIESVLGRIEEVVSLPYDFHEIACTQHITFTDFRSVFPRMTGLNPIE